MDTTGLLDIWEILIPVAMLLYGVKLWISPPAFGTNSGMKTKYSAINKDTWAAGNKFGGQALVVGGVLVGIGTLIQKVFLPENTSVWVNLAFIAFNLVVIFSIVPAINIFLKKKFNLTDPGKK